MNPKHIAAFTYMSAGHVYPYLDVCSELATRGHRVTFPAHEPFATRIREAGVEAIELKPFVFPAPKKLVPHDSVDDSTFWRHFGAVGCPWFMMNALFIVAELEDFYAMNPPDVILYEWLNFAGRIFAKVLQRPAIQMCTHFAHHEAMVRLDGAYTTPQPARDVFPVIDNFMSMSGIEGRDHIWHTEPTNIFLLPREFQYDVESFDNRFNFVGVTFNSRTNTSTWKNGASHGRPILLISEGSLSNDDWFLRLCIKAFSESRYYVVFLRSMHKSDYSSLELPNNFEVNSSMANREILPFADVAVCEAGIGTTLECLYHGVPVVAVPSTPFNSEVAFRVSELGLGAHVPHRGITPPALKTAVDTVSMDDALRRRMNCMREILKNNRGTELSADIIEGSLK